jgi:hypothetical protein
LPWERRHRRLSERIGFFIVVGAAAVIMIIAMVMTFLSVTMFGSTP